MANSALSPEAVTRALGPLLEAARRPSGRIPTTRCPAADVLRALAAGKLDGPLLLATVDHAADCGECLRHVADALEGAFPEVEARPPGRKGGVLTAVIGIAIGTALALWYLFVR